ncbi:MAG: hypothetical protein WDN75_09885 [Bacteroidota bacterium]
MKTKIIILSVAISVLSFSLVSSPAPKKSKAPVTKVSPSQVRPNKGLAMEDRDQF